MLIWIEHFLYLIGWAVIELIKFNLNGFIEMTYWIRIHLTCRCECISEAKLSFAQSIKNTCVELLGFMTITIFIVILINMVESLYKNIFPILV